jgi:outer membrane cobalamin receptor
VSVTVGGRLDYFAETGEERVLPRASAQVVLASRTRLLAAFGNYAQFPSFEALHGQYGNPDLDAERSRHFTLAFEQGLGERTRVRVDLYDQEEDGLLYAPNSEWRRANGRVVVPDLHAPFANALTGHSRGVEVLLQRRSANDFSGWIAYSYGKARRRDETEGLEFDSDFDQRHTLTLYASYRLSQTLNLSAKYRYGSGFPLVGFYSGQLPVPVTLAEERNTLRPDAYGRLDLRVNKAWLFRGWKLTLFGEIVNVFDHDNVRYDVDGLALPSGRVFVSSETLFPLIPALGVVVDF